MNPHPRLRRTLLYISVVALLLITTAWAASGYFYILWHGQSGKYLCLQRGCLILGKYQPPQFIPSFDRGRSLGDPMFHWWPWSVLVWGGWIIWIPLWIPAAPLAILLLTTAHLERRARRQARIARGACPRCQYDRTGLAPNAPCPECGTPAP